MLNIIKFKNKKEKAKDWFIKTFDKHFNDCNKAVVIMNTNDGHYITSYYNCKSKLDKIYLKSILEYDI